MADPQPVPETQALAAPYQPTPPEQAVLAAHYARKKARPPAPRMRTSLADDGLREHGFDHPKPAVAQILLMEALGTLDPDFLDGLLLQLAAASVPSEKSEGLGLNFMLAMVKNVKPRDEIEAMLAAQMAAIHVATMTFARRVKPAAVARMDAAAGSFAKLARTFAAHVDTLKRYRSGAEQKVTVENVTVHDGGQAIVGQVAMGGMEMGARENPRTTPCTEAATEEPTEPMACVSTENPQTTPCTGADASARREADLGSDTEIPRTTSCTGAIAAGWRRRPGAYMRGCAQKSGDDPMNGEFAFLSAPRCTATSKRSRERCKAPALRGCAVCRFHGARGGGPKGPRNGNYRHGLHTRETTEEYRRLLELLRPRGLEP